MSDNNCRGTYPSADKSRVLRFGVFELDVQEAELHKSGIRIKLQEQPFQILTMLLERPGQTVTREDLRTKLWSADTFVDFDHSLNSSIKKLREALGDDSENPRFIETLHRRGYRFIAPVDGAAALAAEQNGQLSGPTTELAAVLPAPTNGSPVIAAAKQHKWGVAVGVFALLILLGATGFGIYSILHRPAARPFQNFTVTQVTNSGKVVSGAISPDGRYLASVQVDKGMQSIWLRNLPTGTDTQTVPPSTSDYGGLEFSPDGNYIYFLMGKNTNWDGYSLFRSLFMGGDPQFLLPNVDSYALSPDGRRIAVGRLNYPEANKYQILTISSDGGDETILQTGSTNQQPWRFAWSPKGDEIYYTYYSREEGVWAIDVFDLRAGKAHRFLSSKRAVLPLQWLPDGHALLVTYWQPGGGGPQIGFIRGASEDVTPITRDADTYWDVTATSDQKSVTTTADGKTIATVQVRFRAAVSVLSRVGREFRNPREILSQPNNDVGGLAWSADGGLLMARGNRLLKMEADGTHQTPLLADANGDIWSLASCGTSYLVLAGNYPHGTNFVTIWRTDADGSHPLKLTNGKWDVFPVCSPDLKWVYYDGGGANPAQQRISRVPLDGSGTPEAMFDQPPNRYFSGGLVISPDGKMLAAAVMKPAAGVDIALYEIGTSYPPRILDASIYSSGISDLQSTHDGSSVAYIKRQDGVDNLWVNRLDGSAAYPITDFKADEIWGFSFSPDGKRLAVVRGHPESDVVLLHETKP